MANRFVDKVATNSLKALRRWSKPTEIAANRMYVLEYGYNSSKILHVKLWLAGVDPILRESRAQIVHRQGCSSFVLDWRLEIDEIIEWRLTRTRETPGPRA